jgi:glycosyltransferase involved in cell wall biosynthesis
MADEASRYTDREFVITPFGVDIDLFSPDRRCRSTDDNNFVVGTVKSLSPKYGIDRILRACRILRDRRPDIPLSIRIAGTGPQESELKSLCHSLGLDQLTSWLGFISQEEAALEWANMDVAVIPSQNESESFGVAAVEAEASGVPVIVSDIPGLMESTRPGLSSLVVPRSSESDITSALERMFDHPDKRKEMGACGRQVAVDQYEYRSCFRLVEAMYYKMIADRNQ